MNILIPLDNEQNISHLSKPKDWAVVTLDNGTKINEMHYKSKNDIKELIDFVVVKDKNEDVEDFLDEDIGVLIAPNKMNTDEIIEAFIFRELYELGS